MSLYRYNVSPQNRMDALMARMEVDGHGDYLPEDSTVLLDWVESPNWATVMHPIVAVTYIHCGLHKYWEEAQTRAVTELAAVVINDMPHELGHLIEMVRKGNAPS